VRRNLRRSLLTTAASGGFPPDCERLARQDEFFTTNTTLRALDPERTGIQGSELVASKVSCFAGFCYERTLVPVFLSATSVADFKGLGSSPALAPGQNYRPGPIRLKYCLHSSCRRLWVVHFFYLYNTFSENA